MFELSSFFEKFRRIKVQNDAQKSLISQIIVKISSVDISNKFFVDKKILRLEVSPIVRNEINFYKNKILLEFKNQNIDIVDLR